jgi:hypothetical protein
MKIYLRVITVVENGADEYNGELCGFMYWNNGFAQKLNTEIWRQKSK